MTRLRVSVRGVVQGVGFRPHVVRLAHVHGLSGEVRNVGGRVEILAEAPAPAFDAFLSALRTELPPQAEIVRLETEPYDGPLPEDGAFRVVESGADDEGAALFPPDLPTCPDCLREMADPGDRRAGHALISCQSCGPRYTIVDRLPYDRENTAMARFPLCPRCAAEYAAPDDRRFHAQTVSCPDCGPQLAFRDASAPADAPAPAAEDALLAAVDALRRGGIVAVKGIGGYHLACRPDLPEAVERLRRLKGRDQKPFAVLFPDLDAIRRLCDVSDAEADLLRSRARPIVLLDRRADADPGPVGPAVVRASRSIGAFLPYTPVQARLTAALGPLVATSANVSDQPILTDDDDVLALVGADGRRPDGVLLHDRPIRTGLDDSVAQSMDGVPQLLRRARGHVPLPVFLPRTGPDLLAAGADLKASFCLARGPYAYPGPFLGDLATEASYRRYAAEADRMSALFGIRPALAVHDLHPGYLSTRYAKSLGLPLLGVQHHHAHVASVAAEHGLEGPFLGIAFDGTGYGTDGTVWGGEFLLCEGDRFERAGHLRPIPMAGGDSVARDGWKAALAHLRDALGPGPAAAAETLCLLGGDGALAAPPGDGPSQAAALLSALDAGIGTHATSSAGRLFDAASALLGVCPVSRYEAEGAIRLENAAREALALGLPAVADALPLDETVDGRLVADPRRLVLALARIGAWHRPVAAAGRPPPEVLTAALEFHETLARTIAAVAARIAARTGVRLAALSGGVFQNRILLARSRRYLEAAGFRVCFNRDVPPNDGGVALGQAWIALAGDPGRRG